MYKLILITHIAIGSIALISGATAILSKKGGKVHTRAGMVYYLCMYGIGVSAFVMTLMKFNPFLMAIAIFALYLTYSGKKAIDNWRLKTAYTPTLKDRIPFYVALATSIFMILFPLIQMSTRKELFVPILSVFGAIMLNASVKDIKKYGNPANFQPRNKMWLLHHIGMMGGAYIATVTAFLVNNIIIDQWWIVWLSPTVIGSALIASAIIKWRKKLRMDVSKPVVAAL